MSESQEPTEETKSAERADAESGHVSDRQATPAEEEAAERSRSEFSADADDVARHEEEMADIGVHVKGEGEID
jgi:hypothetical protein